MPWTSQRIHTDRPQRTHIHTKTYSHKHHRCHRPGNVIHHIIIYCPATILCTQLPLRFSIQSAVKTDTTPHKHTESGTTEWIKQFKTKRLRLRYRTALPLSDGRWTIRGTYSFSVSCVFSVWVFSSTPKIQRVFASWLSFGRKFAKNKRFMQNTGHQQLASKRHFSIMQ